MTLPKWASRSAALAILVFMIWIVYALVLSPVIGAYRDTDEEIEQTSDQLARLERISKSYPELKKQLDELARRTARSGLYLPGDTDALAAAGLQEEVSAKIEQTGGKLRSIQILPATSEGEFTKLSVRVQLTATLGALTQLLYALEAARPFVFVDNLDIKNRRRANSKRKPAEDDPELIIRFDLYGYLRPNIS